MAGPGVGASGPGGARAGASNLEKDLKDLERLLKADASNGAGDGGADASSVKQQLRSVLRKLMEAYFTPLNGALAPPSSNRLGLAPGVAFELARGFPSRSSPTARVDARARRASGPAAKRSDDTAPRHPTQRTNARRGPSSACSRSRSSVTPRCSRVAARSACARSSTSSRSSRPRA
jgi:hypothetical protein